MPANVSAAAAIIGSHVLSNPGKDKDADTTSAPTWDRLPDLPSSDEILADDSSDNLPWFPIKHTWKTKSEYLEALYKILRFEGVEGLRYSVKTVRDSPSMAEDDNTCIYTKVCLFSRHFIGSEPALTTACQLQVHVKGYLFAKLGPIARISFSTHRAGVKIKWKQSKRLQPGKVVAVSSDFFKTDCRVAVVAQRPIEGGLDQSPPVIDIIWATADQALIDPDQELVMVESRNGYFESVRHALKGLQRAAKEWSPLDKYVVSLNRIDLPCPLVPMELDMSSLVDHLTPDQLRTDDKAAEREAFRDTEDRFKNMKRASLNKLSDLKPYTSLDNSQLEALHRIITKEVAIIQGPPGTGKTFTSVKSIMAILNNRRAGDPPVIVSAQTNHALDQLLIYCKSAGANIMRVGGRTDNDEIAQRTMYELRLTANIAGQGPYLDKLRLKIADRFRSLVNGVFGGTGLLDPQTLREAGVITEAQCNSFADEGWEGTNDISAIEAWLGSEKIERIRQETEDLDFEEFEAADEIELEENLNDDQVDDDDDRIYGKFVALSGQNTGQRPHIASWESRCRALLGKHSNLYDIPRGYRGGVYRIMELRLREVTSADFCGILDEAIKQAQEYKVSGWTRDLRVIDRHCIDLIGCTTTGLTKYRGFLSAIQPRILLIEEAAETREANIASALFPSIQQLILVGDHQQLPPSCDIARLAKDPYNLNVSLFERLVENNLPYTMLNRQRRMAPELRAIVQKFYPKLKDHPLVTDVSKRALIPGLGDRRSWFFTHQWPEDTDPDNSKFNQAEVEIIVSFVRYLLHNGVDASEVTILTYYKGQKRKLLHRLRQELTGKFFNVATVDSYQGEENEIVILSLVRSPGPGRDYQVGFVDSRNRATVAISRARRGFFMFGNKENLLSASVDSFTTWAPIWNAFAEQRRVAMSKGIPLVCESHGNEIWVKDADGLVGNAGGCWIQCSGKLKCGHACGRMCHITAHDLLCCQKPCTKILECGHKCAGHCSDPCQCAINCAEYIQIRLRMQLTRAQLHAQPRLADRQVSNPLDVASSGSRALMPADWQDMVQNPEAFDRKERAKAVAKVGITTTTLQDAFGGIQETYIAVSDQDGRRVQGSKKDTDIRKEACLRQQMTTVSSQQASRTNEASRPASINMVTANASAVTNRAGHNIPDTASIIGGIGFDEELSQAMRHVEQLRLTNTRKQASRLHNPIQKSVGGAELLIDFENNTTISLPGKPEQGENKSAELLIDFEHNYALSVTSLDDEVAKEDSLLDNI